MTEHKRIFWFLKIKSARRKAQIQVNGPSQDLK